MVLCFIDTLAALTGWAQGSILALFRFIDTLAALTGWAQGSILMIFFFSDALVTGKDGWGSKMAGNRLRGGQGIGAYGN